MSSLGITAGTHNDMIITRLTTVTSNHPEMRNAFAFFTKPRKFIETLFIKFIKFSFLHFFFWYSFFVIFLNISEWCFARYHFRLVAFSPAFRWPRTFPFSSVTRHLLYVHSAFVSGVIASDIDISREQWVRENDSFCAEKSASSRNLVSSSFNSHSSSSVSIIRSLLF